jgi:hypothetical protein
LFLALASQPAFAGVPNTVAIAVDTSSLVPKIADEVQDGIVTHILAGFGEVMSALAATDIALTPVSEAKTLERVLECEGIECLQDLAQTAKVDLVVQVRVRVKQATKQATKKASKRSKTDYFISMVVARSAPDRDAWSEKADCQACAAGEIKHTASLLASTIAERIKVKTTPTTPMPAVVAPAPAPVTVAPPPLAPQNKPAPSDPDRGWYVPRYLSVAALAGGALLLGSGIYLMHINGQGTCNLSAPKDLCARRYKTGDLGIGLVAGGGVAALAGIVGLVAFSPGAGAGHVALNIGASSISVSGAF